VLDGEDLKALFPVVAPGARPADPRVEPQPSLLPERKREAPAYGMVIDNTLCIGCNACVVACQAENNIPVIGPDEIVHERDMHWLRVDRFDTREDDQDPQPGFQPTPCMHCEHAPCEPVCPVEASVHDEHGLNLQVYNRCIGTRFCEANCPYKVRRFNFLNYQDQGHLYAGLSALPATAQRNPEVTVRARGVMEKCTYCLQRIRASRSVWGDHSPPVTACQAACPTRAIVFGDLADPGSQVAQLQADPRRYALLGHLGTRPRTTYLARVRNVPEEKTRPKAPPKTALATGARPHERLDVRPRARPGPDLGDRGRSRAGAEEGSGLAAGLPDQLRLERRVRRRGVLLVHDRRRGLG
jgi:Fe-S-cluster-containing dehydrogenase component